MDDPRAVVQPDNLDTKHDDLLTVFVALCCGVIAGGCMAKFPTVCALV